MVTRVGKRSTAARVAALVVLSMMLVGCGSTTSAGQAREAAASRSCPVAVIDTLASVLQRVYHEGVKSERTGSANHLIAGSLALREAVLGGDATAATAAAQSLIATGHLTNLRLVVGTRVLVDLGGPALTPIHGSLTDPSTGRVIARYKTSVWSDTGFVAEGDGVAEGLVVLRAKDRSVGGSLALPPGPLPDEGTLTHSGTVYQYTSFPGEAFPLGALRVYLFRPLHSAGALCGKTAQDTVVNTLSRIAQLIYRAEGGRRTLAQVQRVQSNQPLLQAVARRDPTATRVAVEALLHQHIVRLRVIAGGRVLVDDGGPFVLAPVTAPLTLAGKTIGSIVMSIQDDEGYLRLTRRLAGLNVLMYMGANHTRLVKNSLGPNPGTVPASGAYTYHGRNFRVITVNAEAFPSGPLLIRVLVPIPYS